MELDQLMMSSESAQNQVAHISSDEQPGKRIQINDWQQAAVGGARPQQDGDFVDTERQLQPNGLSANHLGHVEVVRDRDLAETEEPNSSYIPSHSVFSGPNTAPNLQQTNSTSNQQNDEAQDERLSDDKSPPLRISEGRTESPNSMVLQQTKKIGGISRPQQRNRNISPDRFKPDEQPEDEVISINSVKELSIVSVSEPVQEKAELAPVNVKAVKGVEADSVEKSPSSEARKIGGVELEAKDSMLIKGGESIGGYEEKVKEDLD